MSSEEWKFRFDFISNGGGDFEVQINQVHPDGFHVLGWTEKVSRREAEELMFQMADVLGWKVGT